MISKIKRLNYRHVLPDVVIFTLSFYASLYLRVDWADFYRFLPVLNKHIALFVGIRLCTFASLGIYDIIWRYISMSDAQRLIRASAISTLIIIAATYVVDIGHLPRATFFIDLLLATTLLGMIRFARRWGYEASFGKKVQANGRRTVIFGAGTNGRTLATRMSTDHDIGLNLIGFLDDDPEKVGRTIAGVKVLGTRANLAEIVRTLGIEELIIATSRPSSELLREVMAATRAAKIKPRLVSALSYHATKKKIIDNLRAVELSDLLNRPKKNIDYTTIRKLIEKRRVLVTGAGGSIGSELSRQILRFNPSTLLLLDHSEYNLYQIDQELRGAPNEAGIIQPLLLDIKDRPALDAVFRRYIPEIVIHAAAYKHVHLVENNPFPAISNNVLGTRHLLELSEEYNVGTFCFDLHR